MIRRFLTFLGDLFTSVLPDFVEYAGDMFLGE
jgi:hypothetical protein